MHSGMILAEDFKVFPMTSTPNDTLAAGTDLPASGSYIYIGDCERYHIILWWGAINAGDTPVVEVKQAPSAGGTPAALSQTNLRHTAANDDDGEFVEFSVETRKHEKGSDYVLLDVIGGVTNATLAAVFLLKCENALPVTQTTAVLPTASQHRFTGGDVA